eukprot:2485387-Amphidinium_carterae.1
MVYMGSPLALLVLLSGLHLSSCNLADRIDAAWINEFHYDNGAPLASIVVELFVTCVVSPMAVAGGSDVGEFVEVVLPQSEWAGDYLVELYNGAWRPYLAARC